VNREEKQAFVDELTGKLRDAQLVVLADYNGLNVETMNRLRRQLDDGDKVELRVVKNTLCSRAVAGSPLEALNPFLNGPTAVVLGLRDPVGPAKVISTFVKENEKLKVKAGFFGGRLITFDEVKALASLPSREVLLGQLLGTLQAPLTQFVGVLAAVSQQFVGVLAAYKDKLEKGA
jgi:large subunit ribosomal protein L10